MKKRYFSAAALLLLLVLTLAGCSAADVIDKPMEVVYRWKSGITKDEDYNAYLSYEEAGVLDEEGYYAGEEVPEEEAEDPEEEKGTVHVTFAQNQYLRIYYYTDERRTERIETSSCFLSPGDSIYASEAICVNDSSSLYSLLEYRIFEYDSEGNRGAQIRQEKSENNLVYRIPDHYTGTELEILPVGAYADRQLTMKAYYTDDEGEEHILTGAGQWFVNGEACTEGEASISALESYTVRFVYDTDSYFYLNASPAPFGTDRGNTGVVEFREADPTEEEAEYAVEVHAWLTLNIRCEKSAAVTVNGGDEEKTARGKVWSAEKLQYGDIIEIETEGDCTITSGDYRHVQAGKTESPQGGIRYTLRIVPESSEDSAEALLDQMDVDRTVTVTLSPDGAYGVCTYTLDGEEVSGTVTMRESQTLKATYQITDADASFHYEGNGVPSVVRNLFSKKKNTVTIPISMNLNNQTLEPDDWFEIEKG